MPPPFEVSLRWASPRIFSYSNARFLGLFDRDNSVIRTLRVTNALWGFLYFTEFQHQVSSRFFFRGPTRAKTVSVVFDWLAASMAEPNRFADEIHRVRYFFSGRYSALPPPSISLKVSLSVSRWHSNSASFIETCFIFFYHKITPSKKVIFAIRPEHNDPLFLNVEDASEDAWDQWDASQKEIHTENEKWCSQNMVSCFNFQKCYRVYSSHSSNLWCL